jgi:plastocyanin
MEHRTSTIRSRVARGAGLGVAMTALLASSVSAATTSVSVNDAKVFNPDAVNQTAGGSVHWQATGFDQHSVTQDAGLFDTGAARAGVDFTRTFSAGTFPYHCRKHGDQGMTGVVRVAPRTSSAPAGLAFTVQWASAGSNTGNRFNVEYKVGSGPFKAWLTNTAARSAVFGARSRPVALVRAKTYSFRVTSLSGTAKSAPSPVKTFRAS